MRYREIPRYPEVKLSEIALGCEGLIGMEQSDFTAFWEEALANGINFIDMYTPNPEFRDKMGEVLKKHRNEIVLQGHIGAVWENGQYLRTRDLEKTKAAFEDQLARLGTDYLEIGMIHYCDAEDDFRNIFEGSFIEYVKKLKAQGKIRMIGISSHNPVIAAMAVKTGLIDVLLFSVNAAYDMAPSDASVNALFEADTYKEANRIDPERRALYELCEREGVAVDVMKAFGGGDMLSEEDSPFGVAFNEYQCLEYCLTRPAVVSVNAGCRTLGEMRRLLGYYDTSEEERDYGSVLAKVTKFNLKGNCMYCGHCAPCTAEINIANVNKFVNLCIAQKEVPETVREHYKVLAHHASECVQCGACMERCPFEVDIIAKMAQAVEIFGE